MSSPKVQLIRDFGCGLGAFDTSAAPVERLDQLEGIAQAAGEGRLLLVTEGRTIAAIATQNEGAAAAPIPEFYCPEAFTGIVPGDQVRIEPSENRIDNLTSGKQFQLK